MDNKSDLLENFWHKSRAGAWAGRGFRFQDAVTCLLAVESWAGHLPAAALVPEGFDDVVAEHSTGINLIQVKSRANPFHQLACEEVGGYE